MLSHAWRELSEFQISIQYSSVSKAHRPLEVADRNAVSF